MGVLLLVRHGQASLGTADYDRLSDRGRLQARLTGERLARADLTPSRVVCGGLVRQRDTAAALMEPLGLPAGDLRVDPRLDEYSHVGAPGAEPAGQSFANATDDASRRALQSTIDEAIARWMTAGDDDHYPESHAAFIGRVTDVTTELAAEPGVTVAVSSAGVIAAITARILGLPVERWPDLARIVVNASVTKLISGRTGTNLLSFNDHAHLEHDRAVTTYR